LSFPDSETGSWFVRPARIKQEVATVKEAGADGFGIYPDLAMLDWQQFWDSLQGLRAKFRKT